MKIINLTASKFAIVDDEDYDRVNKHKWVYCNGYAVCNSKNIPRQMHRFILNLSPEDPETDHINRNRLDNRKLNLRLCTPYQNQLNRRGHIDSFSRFKGVYFDKRCRKWLVRITHNKKTKYIGIFSDENVAGEAYDKAAKELFGEFAFLNFPDK